MEISGFTQKVGARLIADPALPLHIAILYRDVPSAARATGLIERLKERFGDDLELEGNLWSFEVLRLAEVAETAARRIAESDLLVVSATAVDDLPQHVRDCLDHAMLLRGERDIAIVALMERTAAPETTEVCEYLQQLCRVPEDTFFCARHMPLDNCHLTPDRVRHRATATSSVLDNIMHRPLPQNAPWRISE